MATKYRLLKAGQMVTTFRSTTKNPNGRDMHLTQNKVGRKGDEFENLPEFQTDKIKASIKAKAGVWEVVESDDNSATEEEPSGDPVVVDLTPADDPSADPEPPVGHGHEADEGHEHEATFDGLSGERLRQLVEDHALTVTGTGVQGHVKNSDMVKALQVEHGQA